MSIVYLDDIIIMGNDQIGISELKDFVLSVSFVSTWVGCDIFSIKTARPNDGIRMSHMEVCSVLFWRTLVN